MAIPADTFARVEGVHDLTIEDRRVVLTFDGRMEALLAAGMGAATLLDISMEDVTSRRSSSPTTGRPATCRGTTRTATTPRRSVPDVRQPPPDVTR